MKKLFFMAVAAMAALSSCTSDNDLEMNKNTGKEALTFTATMEDSEATRATFDNTNQCAAWEVGDKISINGVSYSAQAAGTATTFKATTTGQEASGPFSAYFACEYDGETATLPSSITETWKEGQFNMPMYATSTTTDLAFKNLCGVLKITVSKSQMAKVKSITVSSANCATSGAFTVNEDAAVLTDASTVANTVTVTYSEAVTVAEAGTVFYVAVPAQTYRNLQIAVSDGTNTKGMCTKYGVDVVIGRNKIYPITFTQNAAYANGIGYVRCVQLWKDGPKFAEFNVGVTDGKAENYGGYFEWSPTDIATTQWGSYWRMPTKDELKALIDNCTCEWTTVNDVSGRKYTGKDDYAPNSIFLPASGFCIYNNVIVPGDIGGFWSSTPDGSDSAYHLYFSSGSQDVSSHGRKFGYSVRAVLEEAASPAPAENKINGHDYVVLAGLKWATENVGEVKEGGTRLYNGTDATYGYYYNQANASTAAESWGGTWKLPTEDQWEALMDENNCTWTWTKQDGKDGYKVSDKNDASKFIFLPAAGYYYDRNIKVYDQGVIGYYWSTDDEGYLHFRNSNRYMSNFNSYRGMAVRPVSN